MDDSFDFDAAIRRLATEKQYLSETEKKISRETLIIKATKNAINQIDEEIREKALAWFLETGDVQPTEAVTVSIIKRKQYDSSANVEKALLESPECLRIDPDKALVHLPEIARHIAYLQNTDLECAGAIVAEVNGLIRSILEMTTTDNQQMAALAKAGADWIDVQEIATPTVKIVSKLGEYILKD